MVCTHGNWGNMGHEAECVSWSINSEDHLNPCSSQLEAVFCCIGNYSLTVLRIKICEAVCAPDHLWLLVLFIRALS